MNESMRRINCKAPVESNCCLLGSQIIRFLTLFQIHFHTHLNFKKNRFLIYITKIATLASHFAFQCCEFVV